MKRSPWVLLIVAGGACAPSPGPAGTGSATESSASASTAPSTGPTSAGTSDTATSQGGSGTAGSTTGPGVDPFPESCSPSTSSAICEGTDTAWCGNGIIEGCELCGSSDTGPPVCMDYLEACDGADLGGETCASLGYVGGTLDCGDTCQHDIRDCDSCLSPPSGLGCVRPRVDGYDVNDIALASNGSVLAAAWVSFDDILHFARFDANLTLLGERACLQLPNVAGVSLAATDSGWVVAVGGTGTDPESQLFALDMEGAETNKRLLTNVAYPVVVDAGGPHLAFISTDFVGAPQAEIRVAQLQADLTFAWEAIVPDLSIPEELSAAASGTGLLVAGRGDGASPSFVVPVAAGGTVGAAVPVTGARRLLLASEGGSVAGIWTTDTAQTVGSFAPDGTLMGVAAPAFGIDDTVATQDFAVSVVGDRVVAMVVAGHRKDVTVAHLDPTGSVVTPVYDLAYEPTEISWVAATTFADETILGWVTHSPTPVLNRFVLARVAS